MTHVEKRFTSLSAASVQPSTLENTDLLSEFDNIPFLCDEICTAVGYSSGLTSSTVADLIKSKQVKPRFKGTTGVPDLRKEFIKFETLFRRIDPDDTPEPGAAIFPIIFRGLSTSEHDRVLHESPYSDANILCLSINLAPVE